MEPFGAWGTNSEYQLGAGTTQNFHATPVQTINLTGIQQTAAGAAHSISLKSDGTVWSWGIDIRGQLGIPRILKSNIPIQPQISSGGSTNDEHAISATENETCNITLTASKITSFTGRTFTLTYDPAVLQLADLCAFTYEQELAVGPIGGADLTVTNVSPGEIVFEVDKVIPQGKTWSGLINIFKFTALSNQSTTVSVT